MTELTMHLLLVAWRKGEEGGHVKHDLASIPLCVHRMRARAATYTSAHDTSSSYCIHKSTAGEREPQYHLHQGLLGTSSTR
jgi:hypothetical protein